MHRPIVFGLHHDLEGVNNLKILIHLYSTNLDDFASQAHRIFNHSSRRVGLIPFQIQNNIVHGYLHPAKTLLMVPILDAQVSRKTDTQRNFSKQSLTSGCFFFSKICLQKVHKFRCGVPCVFLGELFIEAQDWGLKLCAQRRNGK